MSRSTWLHLPLAGSLLLAICACQTSPSAKPTLPPKLGILQAAVQFRQEAMGSHLERAIARYRGESALTCMTGSDGYRKRPLIWSYFFCGSMVLGGCMESPRPIIAFYNPFLDGVLLTQWTRENGQPQLVAADLRIASEMTETRTTEPRLAWWLSQLSRTPLPAAMHDQYTAFVRAFTRQYPADAATALPLHPAAGEPRARDIIERQAAASYAALVALQKPGTQTYNPDLQVLMKALQTGNAQALGSLLPAKNPMSAADLIKQPAWVRQQLVPLYGAIVRDHVLVLLAPVSAPRYLLVAEWALKPTRQVEVIMPFDLDGTARPDYRDPSQRKGQP